MKRTLLLAATAALVATALPSGAAPLPPPGFASPNVEWLGNVPLHADSAGARLVDGYLYVTSSTQLSVYDARVPEAPRLLSTTPLPQQPYFAEEDVDTNGEVLLVSALGALNVVDVRDKAAPQLTATLELDEHTISCVLDCTWAYGSEGAIVDLRDPAAPRLSRHRWTAALPGGGGASHDVTEVAPGLVMTSTETMGLLELGTDPERPTLRGTVPNPDERFIHANLWPRQAEDRFLLVGGETFLGDCSSTTAGAFMVFDTTPGPQGEPRFVQTDEYRPAANGPTEGQGLYETFCSHWFEPRPGWEDGGQLAVGWYEHGTRLLEVSSTGQVEEIGFFSPAGTSASAAYWASDDVLYVIDYQRGLDVLRVHDDGAAAPRQQDGPGLRPDAAPPAGRLVPGLLRLGAFRC